MKHRLGDSVPVSAFLEYPDGRFVGGTSKLDKAYFGNSS